MPSVTMASTMHDPVVRTFPAGPLDSCGSACGAAGAGAGTTADDGVDASAVGISKACWAGWKVWSDTGAPVMGKPGPLARVAENLGPVAPACPAFRCISHEPAPGLGGRWPRRRNRTTETT